MIPGSEFVTIWVCLDAPRICPAKTCFHILGRAVARLALFEKLEVYEAFERFLAEAVAKDSLPIIAYTVIRQKEYIRTGVRFRA